MTDEALQTKKFDHKQIVNWFLKGSCACRNIIACGSSCNGVSRFQLDYATVLYIWMHILVLLCIYDS